MPSNQTHIDHRIQYVIVECFISIPDVYISSPSVNQCAKFSLLRVECLDSLNSWILQYASLRDSVFITPDRTEFDIELIALRRVG